MAKSAVKKRLNIWRKREPKRKANSFSLLSRLIGIETEYGLYRGLPRDDSSQHSISAFDIFDKLVPWIRTKLPTAPSSREPYRIFLANGACVGVETCGTHHSHGGLIEVATPECRSPMELIGYQSVLDRWMVDSLADILPESDARWLKNSSDGYGVAYGQQENYEVQIARGWRLAMWRIGLVAMLPMLIGYRCVASAWTFLVIAFRSLFGRREVTSKSDLRSNDNPTRDFFAEGAESSKSQVNDNTSSRKAFPNELTNPKGIHYSSAEPWVLPVAVGLRWLHWPIAIYFHILIWMFVLVQHRLWLGAFLASRSIVEGSGHVDRRGRFWLSARASQINSEIGFGRYWSECPIFITGHWLRSLLADDSWSCRAWRKMFDAKQRIQIGIGDSTPNDRSQYLRVATTSLVLDLIESGRVKNLPKLKNNLRALKAIATDCSLLRTVPDQLGVVWTAIDLQRQYAGAVRSMISQVQSSTPSSRLEESRNILLSWQETLDQLQESETDPESQKWLLGRVDWFSKRWLMDRSAVPASWAALKKIDLKFHEMDNRGYFLQLARALDIPPLLSAESLDRARRMPPANSPAIRRSYLIREFADHCDGFSADWNEVWWTDERGNSVRVTCN